MGVSVAVMNVEGAGVNHVKGFESFVNSEVNPEKNPLGWRDELESRMESLAVDYAMKHGGEVQIEETLERIELYFNFTGQRFTKPLKEIMNR